MVVYDSLLDDFMIADEEFIGIENKGNHQVFAKIVNTLYEFISFIIRMIKSLTSSIKSLLGTVLSQARTISKNSKVVVDKYGYVEIINKATYVIDSYYEAISRIQDIDHQINRSYNIVGDARDFMKDKVRISLTKKPSQRENHELVIMYFDRCNEYKAILDKLLYDSENLREREKPQRYSLDFITKEMSKAFNTKISKLNQLNNQLEYSKKMYANRGFIYKHMHSEDIKRNRDLLTHTNELLQITEKFKVLYTRLITQVDGVNISEDMLNSNIVSNATQIERINTSDIKVVPS